MSEPSTLILCSHGTRRPAGQRAVLRLAAAVAERVPHLAVRAAYLDVQEPHVDDVVAALTPRDGHAVLVPVLLSTGYHVKTDLTRAATHPRVRLAPPLGPDPRLTDLLVDRLADALGGQALGPLDTVILAGAGSSDPEAGASLAAAAADLAIRLERPVAAGHATGGRPRVTDLISRRERCAGRLIVASYLLAPGFFADRLAASGADLVSEPLLTPERTPQGLVDLVIERAGLAIHAEPELGVPAVAPQLHPPKQPEIEVMALTCDDAAENQHPWLRRVQLWRDRRIPDPSQIIRSSSFFSNSQLHGR